MCTAKKQNGLSIQNLYIYEYARNTASKDVRIDTKKEFDSPEK